MKKIQSIRRQYGNSYLRKVNISTDPFQQFQSWLNEILAADIIDPTAMVLATVDQDGLPDTRIVLLKEFNHEGFVFYTHYDSPKAMQIAHHDKVALNFYWREFSRQIRIRGDVTFTSREESEEYFSSRPRESQIGAIASKQSSVISDRETLELKVKNLTEQYENKEIICPKTWGGYRVVPFEFEFFQGCDNRLNDRIRYTKIQNEWKIDRLSP